MEQRWGNKLSPSLIMLSLNCHVSIQIQCTKTAKCVRAFHTTCAIKEDSGVVLDALVSGRSVIDPNQDQQQQQLAVIDDGHLQLVVACRQHNPVSHRLSQDV